MRRLLHVTGNLPLLCACASLLLAGGTMLFYFDDLFAMKPMARPNSWLMVLAFCAQQLAACLLFAAAPPALMAVAPERHAATVRAMAKAVSHLVTVIVLLCWGQFLRPTALVDFPLGHIDGQAVSPPDGYVNVFVSLLLIDAAIFIASIAVLARDCTLSRPRLAEPGVAMSLSLFGMLHRESRIFSSHSRKCMCHPYSISIAVLLEVECADLPDAGGELPTEQVPPSSDALDEESEEHIRMVEPVLATSRSQ
jgi:hypothetical protein